MLLFARSENSTVRSTLRRWLLGLALTALPARAFAQAAADAPVAARVQPPVVVEEKRPAYPADGGGVRGDVAVMATIGPSGDVTAVELAGSVAPALDRAALQAAMGWRFKPAARGGVPVAARVQLLFHFDPPAEPPPAAVPAPAPAGSTTAQAQAREPPPVVLPLPAAASVPAGSDPGAARKGTRCAGRDGRRAAPAAQPRRLGLPDPRRAAGGGSACQRVGPAAPRARASC